MTIEQAAIDEKRKAKGERTMLRDTRVPTLEELLSRPCTVEELQAALVNLIELYNKQGQKMEAAINGKQSKEWRATM